ncbi:MAG: aromatic ring-hydroxylating dioxygenase subunit alpha [Cycloclasticus sp.]|nr:aromatic ring-hydroxylating dioxygenase subunit alpha [Cycloclasticus sp.]
MMGNVDILAIPPLGSHELGTEAIPADHYSSQEFFELEKEHIFKKTWLLAARESDVAKPGDYVTFFIDALETSIIITRGQDQQLRAFYNACTHRGAYLLNKPCGHTKFMTCGFHGWVFNLEGKLVNVPSEELFADFDKDKLPLRSISIDTWGGFVFINLDPEPEHDLHTYLQPLGEAFDKYLGHSDWSWSYGWRSKFKSNWKLLVDAQIEGYHVDQTHINTIAGAIPGCNAPAEVYPGSIGVPAKISAYLPEKILGVQTDVALLSAKHGATSLYTKSENEFKAEKGEGVLNETHPLWIFDAYLLFPNVVLFIQKGQILLQRTIPISPNECYWEVDFFHTGEIQDFGQLFNSEQGRIQIRDVLTEDLYTAEGIQMNFNAGALKEVQINRQEIPIRAYYHRLMAAMKGKGANK